MWQDGSVAMYQGGTNNRTNLHYVRERTDASHVVLPVECGACNHGNVEHVTWMGTLFGLPYMVTLVPKPNNRCKQNGSETVVFNVEAEGRGINKRLTLKLSQ